MRQAGGGGIPESAPLQYNQAILDDMQHVLLALERRIKDGLGALSYNEVVEMEDRMSRILFEMKSNRNQPVLRPPATSGEPTLTTATTTPVPRVSIPPPTRPSRPMGELTPAAEALAQAPRPPITTRKAIDISEDEGPKYDGRGGMGQPVGTINTYYLPGMDDMTSDEFRLSLQQSLIDRQRQRRESGIVGNRSSADYLRNLAQSSSPTTTTTNNEDERKPEGGSSSEDGGYFPGNKKNRKATGMFKD